MTGMNGFYSAALFMHNPVRSRGEKREPLNGKKKKEGKSERNVLLELLTPRNVTLWRERNTCLSAREAFSLCTNKPEPVGVQKHTRQGS